MTTNDLILLLKNKNDINTWNKCYQEYLRLRTNNLVESKDLKNLCGALLHFSKGLVIVDEVEKTIMSQKLTLLNYDLNSYYINPNLRNIYDERGFLKHEYELTDEQIKAMKYNNVEYIIKYEPQDKTKYDMTDEQLRALKYAQHDIAKYEPSGKIK